MMYVTDGWGSVYAIDVSSGKKGRHQVEVRSRHRPRLGRRRRLLRRQQSRRGAVEGQGDLDRARRPHVRPQQGDRRDGVGAQDRRSRARRDHHAGAAGRARPRHRRRGRRRVRHPRLHRRHRSQYRQAGLAHLHDPGRRRARQRDLEGRQGALEARRRLGVGDRDLRPPTPTPSTRASAMPAPTGIRNTGPATTSGRRACWRSIPTDGKIKWGYQYTPNDPYDFDEISEHPIINAKVNGEDRKLVVHAARNGFYYALDRTNGSFVAGKQYVDELNWTPGLDPKTGRPLNYDPNKDVQVYAAGQPRHARPSRRASAVPVAFRRQELGAHRLQSRAQPALHPVDRRLQSRSTPSSRRTSSTRAAP